VTNEKDPIEPDASEVTEPDAPEPEATEEADTSEVAEPDDTPEDDATPEDAAPEDDATPEDEDSAEQSEPEPRSGVPWSRVLAFGVLPALALVLAISAGVLKWQVNEARQDDAARTESLKAARDTVTVMLTYEPAKIDEQLAQARDLLTGPFRDTYITMTNDIVIPGAKQQGITAVASVPGAAIESVDKNRAVTMLYVNQKVSVGGQMPTDNLSTVRVTLDKVGDRWLVSQFEPE
jgi:Mce-associated membrane protein